MDNCIASLMAFNLLQSLNPSGNSSRVYFSYPPSEKKLPFGTLLPIKNFSRHAH